MVTSWLHNKQHEYDESFHTIGLLKDSILQTSIASLQFSQKTVSYYIESAYLLAKMDLPRIKIFFSAFNINDDLSLSVGSGYLGGSYSTSKRTDDPYNFDISFDKVGKKKNIKNASIAHSGQHRLCRYPPKNVAGETRLP